MSMWMILRIRFLSIGRMLLDLRPAEDPSSIEVSGEIAAFARDFRTRRDGRGSNRRHWPRRSGRSRVRTLAEIGDRAQQLAPMAERRVAARANLIAASTASVPELQKNTLSR
jgi:hypothetical protein